MHACIYIYVMLYSLLGKDIDLALLHMWNILSYMYIIHICTHKVMRYLFKLQLDTLERSQLAARLTLNCSDNYVEPQKLRDVYVTIIDVSKKFFLHCACVVTYVL